MGSPPVGEDLALLRDRKALLDYFAAPLPDQRDDAMSELVNRLAQIPNTRPPRSLFVEADDNVLAGIAERMASLAVRRHSAADIATGLLAIAMAWDTHPDWRDIICVLALLRRSCQILGLDPGSEFAAAAHRVGGKGAQALRDFAARSEADASLEVFWYLETGSEQGPVYEYAWRAEEAREQLSSVELFVNIPARSRTVGWFRLALIDFVLAWGSGIPLDPSRVARAARGLCKAAVDLGLNPEHELASLDLWWPDHKRADLLAFVVRARTEDSQADG